MIANDQQFKEEFVALYGPPVEYAADWYDAMNPHQDLLSLYWRIEAEFKELTDIQKIIVMAAATKDTGAKT